MPDNPQPPHATDIASEEIYRGFIGLQHDEVFSDWVSGALPDQPWRDPGVVDALSTAGVTVDSRLIPEHLRREQLTEEDVQVIRSSETPLITIWGIANAHNIQARVWDQVSMLRRTRELEAVPNETVRRELEILRALPLVHATSMDGFSQIMRDGEIVSNRRAVERFIQLGKLLVHGDPGQTHMGDRKRGLDKYVFFDFGRPAAIHPPGRDQILLVVDQSVMDQPGVFASEQAFEDTFIEAGFDERQAAKDYMRRILVPHRFHEAVRERILRAQTLIKNEDGTSSYEYSTIEGFADGQDMDPSFGGHLDFLFSTYEVKVPKVPASSIKRVIVRDAVVRDALVAQYGEQVDVVLSEDFGPGHYDALRVT